MATQHKNSIKLGLFVLSAFLLLISSFYFIGKNHSMFGTSFKLKARFSHINGLMEGNNILFSGIQAGTVEKISIIDDSTIEVSLRVDRKFMPYIKKNSQVSIGTDGLIGNKVINIIRVSGNSPLIAEGDLLETKRFNDIGDLLTTFNKTNKNAAVISEVLKNAILKVDSSPVFNLLTDKESATLLKSSLTNLNKSAGNINSLTYGLTSLVADIRNGKGGAGVILSDTAFASNLKECLTKFRLAVDNADHLTFQLNGMTNGITKGINDVKTPAGVLLKDSTAAKNLQLTFSNLQKGTDNFNQNMEALKHNFFFKGYFKRLEAQKKKEESNNP